MHHILHDFSSIIHRSVIVKVCEMCSIVLVVPRPSCEATPTYTYESLEQDYTSLIACLYRYRLRRWKISKLLCLRGFCFIFLLDVEVPGSERSSKTSSSRHCWKTGKHRAISWKGISSYVVGEFKTSLIPRLLWPGNEAKSSISWIYTWETSQQSFHSPQFSNYSLAGNCSLVPRLFVGETTWIQG